MKFQAVVFFIFIAFFTLKTLAGQTEIWSHEYPEGPTRSTTIILKNGNLLDVMREGFDKLIEFTPDGERVGERAYSLPDGHHFTYLKEYRGDTILALDTKGEFYFIAGDSELVPLGNAFQGLVEGGTPFSIHRVANIGDTIIVRTFELSDGNTYESAVYYQAEGLVRSVSSSADIVISFSLSPSGRRAELLAEEVSPGMFDFRVSVTGPRGSIEYDSLIPRANFDLREVFIAPDESVFIQGIKDPLMLTNDPVLLKLDQADLSFDTIVFSPPAYSFRAWFNAVDFSDDRSLFLAGTNGDGISDAYVVAIDRWGNFLWEYKRTLSPIDEDRVDNILVNPENPQEIYLLGSGGHNDICCNVFPFIIKLGLPVNRTNRVESTPLQLFPNPASDWLTIEHSPGSVTALEVMDFGGRMVNRYSNESKINVQELPAGTYFIRAYVGERIFVGRFIKK